MKNIKFAILRAGHDGQTMAADLTLSGYEVRLFETEKYRANIDPIIARAIIIF